ncbi:CD82 antigen-like [Candoia aspera]|uniref:CD82 antigen-like n=1 Tax=Candoia aspera TaxID=51853 RepID=UPI002FD7E6DC
MFGFGIWVLISKSAFIPFLQFLTPSFNKLLYIFIAVGAFTMILALSGILGVFWGKRYILFLYIPLLLLIFLLHLIPGLFIYLRQLMIEENISKSIISLIQTYNPTDTTNQTKEIAWDYAQFKLSCCGWTGLENWRNNTFFQGKAGTYPCSCSNHITNFQTALGVCTLDTISYKAAVDDWPVKNQGCETTFFESPVRLLPLSQSFTLV